MPVPAAPQAPPVVPVPPKVIDLTRERGREVDDTEEVEEPPVKRVNSENDAVVDLTRKRGGEDMDEADEPPIKQVKADHSTLIELTCKRGTEDVEEQEELPTKRARADDNTVVDLTQPTVPSKPASLPCVSCSDDYDPSLLPHMFCEHDYCQECLQRVVINALNDEALYPPRCCRQPFQVRPLPLILVLARFVTLIGALHDLSTFLS